MVCFGMGLILPNFMGTQALLIWKIMLLSPKKFSGIIYFFYISNI